MTTHLRRRAPLIALSVGVLASGSVITMAIAAPEGQLIEGYPITGTQDAKGVVTETPVGTDTVRRHVRFGPIHIGPGANVNALALNLPKLGQSGLITRFAYNLE